MVAKLRLEEDLKQAQKSGDGARRDTLRLLLSVVRNEEIEARAKGKDGLSDEEVMKIIAREAKKRKESIEAYRAGGRDDLATGEGAELKIIETYLPEALPESEVENIVRQTIDEVRPEGQKDFGRVMSEAVKKIAGRADGTLVKRVVESCLKQEA